jgi:hypothetical protein
VLLLLLLFVVLLLFGIGHGRGGQQLVESIVLPTSASALLPLILHLVYQHQILAPSYLSRMRKTPTRKYK